MLKIRFFAVSLYFPTKGLRGGFFLHLQIPPIATSSKKSSNNSTASSNAVYSNQSSSSPRIDRSAMASFANASGDEKYFKNHTMFSLSLYPLLFYSMCKPYLI